jgi:hypothetical protein
MKEPNTECENTTMCILLKQIICKNCTKLKHDGNVALIFPICPRVRSTKLLNGFKLNLGLQSQYLQSKEAINTHETCVNNS